jgi:hypothetical protein
MNTEFDRTKFDSALKQFRALSKKAVGTVLKEQARGIMRRVAEFTPPGGKGVQGQEAKKRGEAKVAGDIFKLMERGRKKEISSEAPADIHRRNRDARGRVRRELSPKIKVRASDLAKLLRDKKRMVGFLASGWKAAASKFNARLPAWVARHSGPGSAKVRSDAAMVEVSATNSVAYASRLDIDRRIQSAIDSQAGAMLRQVEKLAIKEAARKAGFRGG